MVASVSPELSTGASVEVVAGEKVGETIASATRGNCGLGPGAGTKELSTTREEPLVASVSLELPAGASVEAVAGGEVGETITSATGGDCALGSGVGDELSTTRDEPPSSHASLVECSVGFAVTIVPATVGLPTAGFTVGALVRPSSAAATGDCALGSDAGTNELSTTREEPPAMPSSAVTTGDCALGLGVGTDELSTTREEPSSFDASLMRSRVGCAVTIASAAVGLPTTGVRVGGSVRPSSVRFIVGNTGLPATGAATGCSVGQTVSACGSFERAFVTCVGVDFCEGLAVIGFGVGGSERLPIAELGAGWDRWSGTGSDSLLLLSVPSLRTGDTAGFVEDAGDCGVAVDDAIGDVSLPSVVGELEDGDCFVDDRDDEDIVENKVGANVADAVSSAVIEEGA